MNYPRRSRQNTDNLNFAFALMHEKPSNHKGFSKIRCTPQKRPFIQNLEFACKGSGVRVAPSPPRRKSLEKSGLFHFLGRRTATLAGGAFIVELARSGRSLPVAENESILQALRTAGITAASSCEEGICGTCEVRVLAGTPDHRDGILNTAERQANRSMMICCSRSIGGRLVLDM